MKTNTIQYAHFGHRFAAMMIDNIIFALLLTPIFSIFFDIKQYTDEEIQQIIQTQGIEGLYALFYSNEVLLQQLIIVVITLFFWIRFAGTPGKRLLKIRIVDAKTGKNLNVWQSIIRYVGYLISSLPMGLGFIWIFLDEKNQGWHDKLANSIVIKDNAYQVKQKEYNSIQKDDIFTA